MQSCGPPGSEFEATASSKPSTHYMQKKKKRHQLTNHILFILSFILVPSFQLNNKKCSKIS